MNENENHRKALIHILHMAYSGELAAGYAYSAHWRSIKDPEQRAGIQKIENEEWAHRKIVGKMLAALNDGPQKPRELMMATIGRTVGLSCFLIGWFFPMYFAGRLESANIMEYENAAFYATKLELYEFAEELIRLANVEREHELFFLRMVNNHYLLPLTKAIFKWGPGADFETSNIDRSVGPAPTDSIP